MLKAYKYRLYPNAEQQVLLSKSFGCARWVYNKGLSIKTEAWEKHKENVGRFALDKMLPAWKKEEQTKWLTEVNAQILQASLANLDKAYTQFFREKKGYPKFKNKNSRQSFQIPQYGKVESEGVTIPRIGSIKAVINRDPIGKVKSITISRTTTGKYFASVLCDDENGTPTKIPTTEQGTIGIDLGLKHFATISTGEKIDNPTFLKKALKQLQRRQRILSRRVKGSSNRNKARQRVAVLHEKISNQRKDFLHKITTRLINENQVDTFALEDLAVGNMMQNKNLRLARSISDVGWAEFRRQLGYKAELAGKNIIMIGRYEPSSKMCSCGDVNDSLRLSDRTWTCPVCRSTHDRDTLAAVNIKAFALHPRNKRSIPSDRRESTLEEIVV